MYLNIDVEEKPEFSHFRLLKNCRSEEEDAAGFLCSAFFPKEAEFSREGVNLSKINLFTIL